MCVRVLVCVSSHSTACQGPLLSKTTSQVLLFKGVSAASVTAAGELSLFFFFSCAAAVQGLLHPRAASSSTPCELN